MIESRNPATGEVVFSTEAAGPAETNETVERALAAAAWWADVDVAERAAVLARFAELVERDRDDLAALIVAEMGKRIGEAQGEVDWTALSARWYAEHPPRVERRGDALVRARPLGVVAAITPWNAPLITPAWKWLPALMAGNCVLWKPSERATAIALAARGRLEEAGLPPEVLQVLPGGPDTARALCAHRDVAGVHFTGSTRAGRAVAEAVAARFARCALEMGGLNVAVVFADADLELAADCITEAAIAINGQKCTATRRVLVERSVHDELLGLLAERWESLVLGDPADEETTLGPLITPAARDEAEQELARAAASGARVVARAPEAAANGVDPRAFFRAALLADVALDDPLRTEELFAPVVAIEPFEGADAAWRSANAGPYGLSASVYTRDPSTAEVASRRIATGVLAVNRRGDAVDLEAPFGGVKDSGNGLTEGGEYVYAGLTTLQAVYGHSPAE
ncbi:MAG: aldehyde dehydrogenase family protein [Actinobacteria bacterium]|nr:aldehyde dehydrogenase family protein [Actinomycetota bacterium]